MALSETEVLQILKMVEESSFGELRLETGDLKLIVRKNGCAPSAPEPDFAAPTAAAAQVTSAPVRENVATTATAAKPAAPAKAPVVQEGTIPIKSPMLGTFYRRPSPDAPPYVEVGAFVTEDDTVCLIEVMKVFTAVKAGVRGHITEILVENNQLVEYGQPMFLVKPEAEAPKKQ